MIPVTNNSVKRRNRNAPSSKVSCPLTESQYYTFYNPSGKISSFMFRSLSQVPLGSPSLTFCLAIQSARDASCSHCDATSGTFSQNATISWLEECLASVTETSECPLGTSSSCHVALEFGSGLRRGGFRVKVHPYKTCSS